MQVALVTVHAAVRQQSDEMQRAAAAGAAIHRCRERRVVKKASVADAAIDAGEILVHDAPRAQIHVAHFGIAHLALRQPHGCAARHERGVRVLVDQLRVRRGARLRDRVVVGRCAESPTVEYDEHEGL